MSWQILYVDDEDDIRRIVEFALEDEPDFQLRLCAGGAAALQAVREAQPDLVLLDVMMPVMDGPATLRQLQSLPIPPPVVFITAKVQPQEVAQLKALGAIDVIAKPFDPLALPQQVRELCQQLSGKERGQ